MNIVAADFSGKLILGKCCPTGRPKDFYLAFKVNLRSTKNLKLSFSKLAFAEN